MRRPQYSLKTLFLLVTIVALLLLWYRDHVRLARLEEEIVPLLRQSLAEQEQEVKLLDQKLATAVRKFRPPQGAFIFPQGSGVIPAERRSRPNQGTFGPSPRVRAAPLEASSSE